VSGEYTRWSDYSPSTESNGDGDTRVIEILVIESVGKFSPWFPAHSLESGIHADEHFKKFTNFIRHAMPQLNRTGRLYFEQFETDEDGYTGLVEPYIFVCLH
jgi:hypothetical protein